MIPEIINSKKSLILTINFDIKKHKLMYTIENKNHIKNFIHSSILLLKKIIR